MPVYEFTCRECATEFEELVRSDERVACPSCSSKRVEKRFSTFATQNAPSSAAPTSLPGGCGTCGDPRGPGACAMN